MGIEGLVADIIGIEEVSVKQNEKMGHAIGYYRDHSRNAPNISGVYETQETSDAIAEWVIPLHLEKNLNSARSALSEIDNLLAERRAIKVFELHAHFFEFEIRSSSNPARQAALEKHKSLVNDLAAKDMEEDLDLRICYKILDLCEYVKAAKFAAKHLLDLALPEFEVDDSYASLSRIRESMRKLILAYRRMESTAQEVIVPVSLKWAKSKNDNRPGGYVADQWQESDARNPYTGLADPKLALNLRKDSFENFARIAPGDRKLMLRRIGAQVIDKTAITQLFLKQEELEKTHGIDLVHFSRESYLHKHRWCITLKDTGDHDDLPGISLGAGGSRFTIPTIRFDSVVSSDGSGSIQWSNLPALINYNPDRKWEFEIYSPPHNELSKELRQKRIRDVVLYFHVAYLN